MIEPAFVSFVDLDGEDLGEWTATPVVPLVGDYVVLVDNGWVVKSRSFRMDARGNLFVVVELDGPRRSASSPY